MRVINSDVMLDFGKHKGKPTSDVLKTDPSYFFWLLVYKKANLAPDVLDKVLDWAATHTGESNRIIAAAKSQGVDVRVWEDADARDAAEDALAGPPLSIKPAVVNNEAWGSW